MVGNKHENRFQFIPFAERINKINVDVSHAVPHRNEDVEDETRSYLQDSCNKWIVQNRSKEWKEFHKELSQIGIRTLAQVLHNKDKIANMFLVKLPQQVELSLQPVLESLTAFVKDIRNEFSPYFHDTLKRLISLLKIHDPEVIEWTFVCLAYIFKYIYRFLLKHLDQVLIQLVPLLDKSQPDYIQNFAAESFGYVARHVKSFQPFLMLCLETLQKNETMTYGVGRLVFETMYGIKGKPNSKAEEILNMIFNLYFNPSIPIRLLHDLTQVIARAYAERIHGGYSTILSNIIKSIRDNIGLSQQNRKSFVYLLQLVSVLLDYKDHVSVKSISELVKMLKELPVHAIDAVGPVVVHIASRLQQSFQLMQSTASELTSLMLQLPKELLLLYVDNVCECAGFEATLLPSLLNMCTANDQPLLNSLTKVVSLNLLKNKIYRLQFRTSLANSLVDRVAEWNPNSSEDISSYIFLLPHISLDNRRVVNVLEELISKIISTGSEHLFLLYIVANAINEIEFEELNLNFQEIYEKLLILIEKSFLAFGILEVLIRLESKTGSSLLAKSENIRKEAFNLLLSPYHKKRTCALRVLLLMESSNNGRLSEVLGFCLSAEMVALNVQTYRNATVHVREVYADKIALFPDQAHIIVRWLLGYLHSNFSLLEKELIPAIQSYDQTKCDQVWRVIMNQVNVIENESISVDKGYPLHLHDWAAHHFDCGDRVDLNLYRERVWKVIKSFDMSEDQEKDVIDHALQFSNLQMVKNTWQYTCDLRSRDLCTGEQLDHTVDEGTPNIRVNKRLLTSQLHVIAKSRAHAVLKHRMNEMKKLCTGLLTDSDTVLRKAALDCLVASTPRTLAPYKNNLSNLIDDEGFKTAMVFFQLDKDKDVVKEAHRSAVMPIVLRLLYSKMVSTGPIRRGNKSSAAAVQRKQVMRFLAGCLHSEIQEFLSMAFVALNIDPKGEKSSGKIADGMVDVSLERVMHPRKLQSAINLAEIILDHLGGHLSDELQRFMFHVVLSIAATSTAVLSARETVLSGFLPLFKKIRGACLVLITTFFDKFHCFNWLDEDIDAVFRIMVWPIAAKLANEGIHSPTPLLKLFAGWAKNPRYFALLSRHMPDSVTQTPLSFIMELFLREQCQQSVLTEIGVILENLLTLRDDQSMETDQPAPPPLVISHTRPVDANILKELNVQNMNYGSQLLIPHVGDILEFLRKQLSRNEKRGLTKSEAVVLARITELANCAEHGDALIHVILRVLTVKPPHDPEVLVDTVATVKNLIAIVSRPLTYLRSLAVLFQHIELVQARKLLISCVGELASRCPEVVDIAEMVECLNAYDRRWIDQCDYNRRLDALKTVRLKAAQGALTVDAAAFVIHVTFFFLKTENDLSIRDSAELCLKEVCPQLLATVKQSPGENQFVTETLLKAILSAVQGKDDRFKTSAIGILAVLARECSDSHIVFKDLNLFTNKADMEVDFFENLIHLQLYRRNRALLKLSSTIKSLREPIAMRTVTQYLMPMANQFLCNETYSGKNSLVDAAIECVGTLSRLLPWYQYQSVLKHYLMKLRTQLEYQRQCVRLVIAILDAFHFDISRSQEAPEQTDRAREKLHIEIQEDKGDAIEVSDSIEDIALEDENESADVVEDIVDGIINQVVSEESNEIETEAMDVDECNLLVDTIAVLKPAAAKRVERAISEELLEQLYKAIGQRTAIEKTHKVNKKSLGPDKDEEDILRIPIAVTLVKLLQKLPGDILDNQLPGIITKLCTFLKSHLESVRRVTRETLQQIMTSMGPERLPLLLTEMTELLTKGFQCHVLVFTINAVIQALQPALRPGHIDRVLPTILQVCSADLFGSASEEKEVVRMQVKHKEVRSNKSFNLLHLVAQFITDKCLTDLILPIKCALSAKSSHKMITKCRECLRQIYLGLTMNSFIPTESLFIFLYGAVSESIPELMPTPPLKPKKRNPKEVPHCLLLAPEPKSRAASAPVQKSARAGAHVFVEFGLHMLQILLKQDKLKKTDFAPFLDPLVPVLRSAVESQHVKVSTLAVKCLSRMMKLNLPKLEEHIKPITESLFLTLHKFASAGLSKGDNFDLVLAVFQIMSVIVRDVEYYTVTQDQLRALLLYAEQDIYDNSRQAVAFALIKAVLKRKLTAPELHSVLEKVGRLAITSDMEHVRTQARQTMLKYIMDYPLKTQLDDLIGFFLGQFGYELESGRKSALEMVFTLINAFPEKILVQYSGIFYISLGIRLVNDDSADCKKMVAAVIKGMLSKLQSADRDTLFEMNLTWLNQKNILHKRLAVQLVGIFVTVEKDDFSRRLPQLLPLIQKQLIREAKPGRFVKIEKEEQKVEEQMDRHYYFVLLLLVKLSVNCPALLTNDDHKQFVSVFVDMAHNMLTHEHEWVRAGSAQFLGVVFNSIKPVVLTNALNSLESESADVRFWDVTTFGSKIRGLILDHVAQFIPGVELSHEFQDQLMKNLVYLARVLNGVVSKAGHKDDMAMEDSEAAPTLSWMVRRMRKLVNLEVARTPGTNTIRTAVFMWTGAVTVCLSKEELLPVLYHLAAPLVRELELALPDTRTPLIILATEVINKIKKKVGVDEFAEIVVKLQSKLMEKRAKRKSGIAQEFVTDPERAVKRKLERHAKKKEGKKRKIELLRKKAGKFKRNKSKIRNS